MNKKIFSYLLVLVVAIGVLAGCSSKANEKEEVKDTGNTSSEGTEAPNKEDNTAVEEPDPYAEKITFTVLSLDDTENFMNYPLVVEAKEKFNFDFEIQQVAWDNWDQTVRTLAATDSLPEVITWYNLNYEEYLNWVEQGVLKSLPDDLTAFPEIQRITDSYSVFDHIRVDGSLYAFPKVMNSNPYNNFDPYFIAYRRDWASEMGKDFAPVEELTWNEFVSFLEEVKAKDVAGLQDKLVPFDLVDGGGSWLQFIRRSFNNGISGFIKADGQYVWGPRNESSLDGIYALKDMYDKGLIARDSYADKKGMGKERFYAGRSAVFFSNFNISTLNDAVQNIQKSDPSFTENDLGLLVVANPSGQYLVTQKSEWWAAMAFSSKCRDEVMERWLAVGNWMIEQEQVEKYAYGIPGEDWTRDDSGKITLNWTPEDVVKGGPKDYIVDQRLFQKFFILEGMDVWLEGNPAYSSYLVNDLFKTALQTYEKNPLYTPSDYDLGFFSGPKKNEFIGLLGTETNNAVIQAVLSDNPEKVWNEFLEKNAKMADEVLAELNAEFGE